MSTQNANPQDSLQRLVSPRSGVIAASNRELERGAGAELRPYYDAGGVTLYHGDCRDVLPLIEGCDLLLTDPPYGIFKNAGGSGMMFGAKTIYCEDKSAAEWDTRPDAGTLRLALSKCQRHVIWGGNYLADMLGACKGPLVWNKLTGNNSYADGEMAWSDVAGTMRIFTHQWCGAFKDSERGQRAMHPTQKPLALMSWCISLAKDAKSVLDPFAGSGTALVAAKERGLRAIGIEAREEYCALIVKRLAQEFLPLGAGVGGDAPVRHDGKRTNS
jgi:hypothetical protein